MVYPISVAHAGRKTGSAPVPEPVAPPGSRPRPASRTGAALYQAAASGRSMGSERQALSQRKRKGAGPPVPPGVLVPRSSPVDDRPAMPLLPLLALRAGLTRDQRLI